ncbi:MULTISPECIES: hypothetical protein [unclassified Kribbella]|uniref:hypothetical protein n=1 Tax=unclassified Kribbella TaxID=2644121 RepID=UPI00301831F0
MADRFDLDAIDADDALLDLLAAGGESARTAGEHDPAVKLLADLRLAVEVEDELPVETIDDPESFLARCAALNPVTDPFARKVATRGLALGVAAVAALSVSGVAAAVTGDPLSPYEKVIEKMVDAVRPQTSFPKEQLDGMPVVDKTKIVKVAKDFQKKQEERKVEQEKKAQTEAFPPQVMVAPPPPLLRPPVEEKPMAIEKPLAPVAPEQTTAPEQTPADEPTTAPTDEPTTTPTEPPATTPPPTTEPTEPPATSEPTPDPTTTTPTTPTNNGETGETGTDPTPTTLPSNDNGSKPSESGDDQSAELPEAPKPPVVDDTAQPPAGTDQKTPPAEDKPQPPAASPLDGLVDLVEKVLEPVLPTPTASVEASSAEHLSGSGVKPEGRHSSGQVVTGSVKETYAKGKHSTGQYVEGKHAAIARTHGSTDSTNVLTILGVVNKPLS